MNPSIIDADGRLKSVVTAGVLGASTSILDRDRLTLTQAARLLNVSLSTLHRWRLKKGLRFMKIGGRTYVLREELERFVKALSDPPPKEFSDADLNRRAADADARARALGL